MSTFLQDLKTFFEGKEYANIGRDFLPDTPDEAIGLFLFSSPSPGDGTVMRYVQVQVRAADKDAAYNRASAMFPNVDSGPDETLIFLTASRWCVGQIRSRPRLLKLDGSNRPIYYFEFSLLCEDIP